MKEFQIKNIHNIEAQVNAKDGNEFSIKPVFDNGLMEKCAASFIEVKPGSYAFGYHYHETVEEIFVIISGEGSVRTYNGDIAIKAGDAISFPTGEGGAHVVTNTSKDQTLTYIDFGTRGGCDIAHLPDIKKILVNGPQTNGMFDEQ